MASKAERFELRLSEEKKSRWTAGAKERGYTLAEFIDGAVEAELAGSSVLRRSSPTRAAAKKASAKTRTEMCAHRRRPDEYCSRCD